MPSPLKQIGKYEILGELGRGAMGTVYEARDPMLDRLVALKTMSEAVLAGRQDARARFDREAQSAARLQHPNIVTIFELGEVDNAPFIAMELLGGESLADVMERAEKTRLEDKLKIITQVCRGLDYAHKQGVIHRDIKPGNIQVLEDGTAKILDFGIARREGLTVITETGLAMGTPNYMAPEQISGLPVDHRADMWAVGIILHEWMTGERPFAAETIPSLVYHIVHSLPPTVNAREMGLPPALVAVMEKVLRKDPNERFRDLLQMAAALDAVVGGPALEDADAPSDDVRQRTFSRHVEMARMLLSRGEPVRALEAARRAQALEPSEPTVVILVQQAERDLRQMGQQQTIVSRAPAISTRGVLSGEARVDVEKWIDEARLALTAGRRAEAINIVGDVLTLHPDFRPALELRELLDAPSVPGRPRTARTGRLRKSLTSHVRTSRAYEEVVTFGEPQGLRLLARGPDETVAVGGTDGSVRLWSLAGRSRLALFRSGVHQRSGHEGLVTSLVFSPDWSLLAAGHVDGAIHIWELETGTELAVKLGHTSSVGQLAFSPDGGTLASGGLDSTVKLWEVAGFESGEARRRLIRQPSGVTALCYSIDGTSLIVGQTNRVLRVLDVATGRLTATLRGHESAIDVIRLSPDGDEIATGGRDHSIRLYDLNRRAESNVLAGHKKSITSADYFPDGREIVSVSMSNSLVIWDIGEAVATNTLWGETGESFASVVVLPDESILVGVADGRLRIFGAV